jgi:hypothetical protein
LVFSGYDVTALLENKFRFVDRMGKTAGDEQATVSDKSRQVLA